MADPWTWWSAASIASASACPLEHVEEHWPRIFAQLGRCGIQTPNVGIGIIGTSAIESASQFAPVREAFYLGEPEPAESHRQTLEYYPFYGRGHIQLTWESNYDAYGPKVAELWGTSSSLFDLVADPDAALDPDVAAAVIALYFRDTRALPSASYPEGYTLVQACEAQDWAWVRILVYGGEDPAGTARIAGIEEALGPPGGETVTEPAPVPVPAYDATFPAFAQNDDWSCAPTSTRWALWAYGRQPSESWLESSMLQAGVVTQQYGLMDASGAQLAGWLNAEYGPPEYGGYHATNDPSVTFQEAAAEAARGRHPFVMGGRTWCHWTGVRGFDGSELLLANPASGWMGVAQRMSSDQFAYLGPFSLVRLANPAAEATTPPPKPNPEDPYAPWAGLVGSGILEQMAIDGTTPAVSRSTFMPLGVNPADTEQCLGRNGVLYVWAMSMSQCFRYAPM